MSPPETNLTERSHAALGDSTLQRALASATNTFIERRREAITSVDDWEALRVRARRVKEHTINHLDYYQLRDHLIAFLEERAIMRA